MKTCKNCGNGFEGRYCNDCGQKFYTDVDKSIGNLLEDALHFITHFEGNLIHTLKSILVHPGKLSQDFCNGIRKKYFKPVSFFLLLIVLYLIFPLFEGLNMDLKYYKSLPTLDHFPLVKREVFINHIISHLVICQN